MWALKYWSQVLLPPEQPPYKSGAQGSWDLEDRRWAIQYRIQSKQPVEHPENSGHLTSSLSLAYTVLHKSAYLETIPTNSSTKTKEESLLFPNSSLTERRRGFQVTRVSSSVVRDLLLPTEIWTHFLVSLETVLRTKPQALWEVFISSAHPLLPYRREWVWLAGYHTFLWRKRRESLFLGLSLLGIKNDQKKLHD